MCVFGKVLLSALWWVLGKYWMCVFGDVSLIVLWRYWVSIGCNVFGMISLSVFLAGIGLLLAVCTWQGFVECIMAGIGCVYFLRFR